MVNDNLLKSALLKKSLSLEKQKERKRIIFHLGFNQAIRQRILFLEPQVCWFVVNVSLMRTSEVGEPLNLIEFIGIISFSPVLLNLCPTSH